MKDLKCPNCHGQLSGEIVNGRTTCPYCSSIIVIDDGSNEVKDINRGITIATAQCPKGYVLGGAMDETVQSSAYPLTTLIWCDNVDKSIRFLRESGKAYQQIIKHLLLRHQEGAMEPHYTIPMLTFHTVEQYLNMTAANMYPGKNITIEKDIDMMPVERVDDSIPRVVQVEMELQAERLSNGVENQYGKSLTRLFKTEEGYLLLSTTVFGLKWYVNGPSMPDFGLFGKKIADAFMGKQGQNQSQQQQAVDPVFQAMTTPTQGKPVVINNWWVPAIYAMITKEIPTPEILRDFSIFCNSVRESDMLAQRRFQISEQYISNMYIATQQEFANADAFSANAQQDIFRRQNQISQSISQRNNIIMSTYENRVAAQDRMRQARSEATRGVDTYKTSSGTTEFKTGAQRVVQKNNDPKQKIEIGYLDKVPDGWTEIFKK